MAGNKTISDGQHPVVPYDVEMVLHTVLRKVARGLQKIMAPAVNKTAFETCNRLAAEKTWFDAKVTLLIHGEG